MRSLLPARSTRALAVLCVVAVPVFITPIPDVADAQSTGSADAGASCDRLAGSPEDPQRIGPGVDFGKISLAEALAACAAAVERSPHNPRYDFQYSRALNQAQRYEEEVSYLRRAADQGYAPAMNNLSNALMQGRGVERSVAEGIRWLQRAADAGLRVALFNLARAYENGTSVERDVARAAALFRQAAERGHSAAMVSLASAYFDGRGVIASDVEAAAWVVRAIEQGNADAMTYRAWMSENGRGVAKDEPQAAAWYRRAADAGNAVGMYRLATLYEAGRGVARNQVEAFAWYRRAADLGDASSQFNVALRLAAGQGVAKDEAQAAAWFRKAADQGHAPSQNNLGLAYFDGRGVTKNEAEAVAWFRKAAAQSQPDAMNNLALAHFEGRGVAKNPTQAIEWYRKAAELGNVTAQYSLARALARGDGTARDDAQAAVWYRKAADQGHGRAQLNLARAYATGAGIARDDAEAARWLRTAVEFPTIPIASWVGLRFVFQPADNLSRSSDYAPFYSVETGKKTAPLPYAAYVGKVVTVVKVTRDAYGLGSAGDSDFLIDLVVQGTNERLQTVAMQDAFLTRLAPAADVGRARALLIDEVLWRESGSLRRIQPNGELDFFPVGPFDALTVVDVKASDDRSAPVRIVVRTPAGAQGFVDVNFSGTNLAKGSRDFNRFETEFQISEPRRETPAEAARSFRPSAEAVARAASRNDVLGWDQTWWGMKTDELLQARVIGLQKLAERQLFAGLYGEFVVPRQVIDGNPYLVTFQFDTRTNRLQQVLVTSPPYSKDVADTTAYDRLVALYERRYGPGAGADKDRTSATYVTRRRQWVRPTTTMEISYSFSPGSTLNRVTVTYYPTGSRDR